jgi:hypothetical protein
MYLRERQNEFTSIGGIEIKFVHKMAKKQSHFRKSSQVLPCTNEAMLPRHQTKYLSIVNKKMSFIGLIINMARK